MQGDQPRANAAPSTGGPARPQLSRWGCQRSSRDAGVSRCPAASTARQPKPTTATPIATWSVSRCTLSNRPAVVALAPSPMKTTVKPAQNSMTDVVTRGRTPTAPAGCDVPPRIARYVGTRGRTQGEPNDTSPASTAAAVRATVGVIPPPVVEPPLRRCRTCPAAPPYDGRRRGRRRRRAGGSRPARDEGACPPGDG